MSDSCQPIRRFSLNQAPGMTFQRTLKKPIPIGCVPINEAFEVESLEGLVRGIQGELYGCDREIFEKTYELLGSR